MPQCKRARFSLSKNIVTSSGPFRSKSLLSAIAGQGPQQNQHAGHFQRATFFLATRCGIHGICQIAEAGVARRVANLETSGVPYCFLTNSIERERRIIALSTEYQYCCISIFGHLKN